MSFLGLASFGLAPKEEKRMDIVSDDLPRNTSGQLDDSGNPAGADSSGDVSDANGISGNPPAMGPAVVPCKVADATSKNVSVQHSPAASRVKP